MGWMDSGRVGIVALAFAAVAALSGTAAAGVKVGEGVKIELGSLPDNAAIAFSVPTIRTLNSSMDLAALRDVLSGNIAGHAADLARLRAERIAFPEFRVDYSFPAEDGQIITGYFAWHNVRLIKVRKGVAQAVIIDSAESSNNDGTTKLGRSSMEDFNIAGLLAFFGVVKPEHASSKPAILYRNVIAAGGTLTMTEGKGTCTLGGQTIEYLRARPPRTSFPEIMALAKAQAGKEKPDAATLSTFVTFFTDIVEGTEAGHVRFGGFDCDGIDDEGKPIRVKIGSINIGAYAAPRAPHMVVRNIAIESPGKGAIGLGRFRFKGFDFGHALATLESADGAFSEAWFDEHARDLVPEFPGLSFARFAIDIPAADDSSERIRGSIEDFDLTLKNYINGIPTDAATSAHHIVAHLPTSSEDTSVRQLLAYGIDKFDLGFDIALKWDEPSQEIRLGKFNIVGIDMGSIAVTSTLGKATRDLFSADLNVALVSALGLTLKGVNIDMKDIGLGDIIVKATAKGADEDVKAFREALAGLTQGTMLMFLGGVSDADEITKAVGAFINGGKSLSVSVTSKDPAGIPFAALEALRENPLALIDLLTIKATAK